MARQERTSVQHSDWDPIAMRRLVAALSASTCLTAMLVACGGSPAAPGQQLAAGAWGGDHVRLSVTANDASVEFDCAHGSVAQAVRLDANDRFDVAGVYVREHGGPVRVDEPPDSHPARYSGTVNGGVMQLTVTTTDDNREVGSFVLVLGQAGRIVKCV
jgi:major membrane immunogen (membrane-anchored lipoprotein)